jgi:hypothetical protein
LRYRVCFKIKHFYLAQLLKGSQIANKYYLRAFSKSFDMGGSRKTFIFTGVFIRIQYQELNDLKIK